MTTGCRLILSPTNVLYAPTAFATFVGGAEVLFDSSAAVPVLEVEGVKHNNATVEQMMWALTKPEAASTSNESTPFLELSKSLVKSDSVNESVAALNYLDDHLAFKAYLVDHDISASDWLIWGSIKGSVRLIGLLRNGRHQHLSRWFSHLENLPSTQRLLASLGEARLAKARSGTKTASSFSLGLPGATKGNVVTRFPPEPSGYLHIGHAKAALLNQYFARMYDGRLIVRFDDTNPSKEKTEFEESILQDLRLLGIEADMITHTSDHFDKLYDLAVQLIEAGKAYADDTDNSTLLDIPCSCPRRQHGHLSEMAHRRWHGISSARRDASVQESLARFLDMKEGTDEGARWCIRAKVSVDHPNKAMRDPVIYRVNLTPHHRTGTHWKIYPTYDFACPVVDSLEGVTHALRTNEYRDRNAQYMWMSDALALRPVQVWDFSRLNFVYTLLSKRKLHWFVDRGLVRGWDDPRFPTVRGIRRRGMTIEALSQFMLSQGPSQAIVSLEWDSIWAINKKVIDPVAPRFWAVVKENIVPVTLINGPSTPYTQTQPKHKKNAGIGEKQVVYSSSLFIEQTDALSLDDQEEMTLMSWGNAIVRSREVSSSGQVTAMTLELRLEGDFRLTKKKITWLAESSLVDVTLIDYDYLITKKKLDVGDRLEDVVAPMTEFRDDAIADANLLGLAPGDIIQFERKGYYILDRKQLADDRGTPQMEFIRIPDGRAASLARKAATEPPSASPT